MIPFCRLMLRASIMGQVNEPLGDGAKTTAKLSLIAVKPTFVPTLFVSTALKNFLGLSMNISQWS
jgi:hypothetical protein